MTERQIIAAINRELKRLGVSRAELARRLKLPRQNVTNMLNRSGDRRLNTGDIVAIVAALHPQIDAVETLLAAAGMIGAPAKTPPPAAR